MWQFWKHIYCLRFIYNHFPNHPPTPKKQNHNPDLFHGTFWKNWTSLLQLVLGTATVSCSTSRSKGSAPKRQMDTVRAIAPKQQAREGLSRLCKLRRSMWLALEPLGATDTSKSHVPFKEELTHKRIVPYCPGFLQHPPSEEKEHRFQTQETRSKHHILICRYAFLDLIMYIMWLFLLQLYLRGK